MFSCCFVYFVDRTVLSTRNDPRINTKHHEQQNPLLDEPSASRNPRFDCPALFVLRLSLDIGAGSNSNPNTNRPFVRHDQSSQNTSRAWSTGKVSSPLLKYNQHEQGRF